MPFNRAGRQSSHGKRTRSRRGVRVSARTSRWTQHPAPQIGVWLRAGLIVLAGAATYWNSLGGPFINDDHLSIVTNRQILRLWPLSSVLFPARELPVAGRPLVNISFAVNYAMGGLEVGGYHVVNIAIHLLCALVLFGVIRRTLSLACFKGRLAGRSDDIAFASALIWTLHPLQTETVDYLTQRTESMMALFYLLTLYSSIRASLSPPGTMWQMACVMSSALGMACKESMVTAPFMVLLYDRIFVFDSLKQAFRSRWRLYIGLVATWAELAALMVSGPRVHSTGFSTGISPWTYLLNQTVMIAQYLKRAIWPRSLVFDYGVPQPLTLGDVMPYALLIVLLLLLTIVALVRQPRLGFLGAWFFMTLAPTSSVVPIATEVGAERRMYLPLAALVVLAVISASLLWNRLGRTGAARPELVPKKAAVAFAMTVLTVTSATLAAGTVRRNREYASREALARTTLERWPQPRAHRMLAAALLDTGHREEAIRHLRVAIPDDHHAYYSLGLELFNEGKLDEAIQLLAEFIRLEPALLEVISARETIGLALQKQGKLDEAADQFRTILTMTPGYADAHRRLADAFFAQQKYEEASVEYREFLKSRPRDFNALTNLGISQAATGHTDEALRWFRLAADIEPQNSAAHRNLANTFLTGREFGQAAVHAQQALSLNPRDPVAHDILGLALASGGKLDEAIEQFQRALQLDPNDAEARDNLTMVQRAKGASAEK